MKKKTKPQINSFVVFDINTIPEQYRSGKDYKKYYKKHENKRYIYLGEIYQCLGHCILLDVESGKVESMYHTNNFRQLTEEEC